MLLVSQLKTLDGTASTFLHEHIAKGPARLVSVAKSCCWWLIVAAVRTAGIYLIYILAAFRLYTGGRE
jgi:hypothetical protein